jgi:ABC-type transporter Mla subunit MlaD
MDDRSTSDLIKIGIVTVLGFAALMVFIFWLKGHKFHYYEKFTFYFKNVNGLEEGAALHWNGMKIGVVEAVIPVTKDLELDSLPSERLIELGRKHLAEAKQLLHNARIEDLVFARENINKAQLEIALGRLSRLQTIVREGEHVKVDVVVTSRDVPIGLINQVTIVPSGLIGEQYVNISTIDLGEIAMKDLRKAKKTDETHIPQFVVLEPIRLDNLLRINTESAESIRNLANRFNALFSDEDATNIKQLIDAANSLAGDPDFKHNVKESVKNINEFSKNPSIWKLLF